MHILCIIDSRRFLGIEKCLKVILVVVGFLLALRQLIGIDHRSENRLRGRCAGGLVRKKIATERL
jgi:hypothetical protein